MNKFWYILKFEILSHLKSKAFIISTIITLVMVLIGVNVPGIINAYNNIKGDKEDKSKNAIYFDLESSYSKEDLEEYMPNFKWEKASSVDLVEKGVEENNYNVGLILDGFKVKVYSRADNLMNQFSEGSLNSLIRNKYQISMLEEANFSKAEMDDFFEKKIETEIIPLGKDISQTYWVGYILLMVLYMAVILYGQSILMSVITEKSTKTMELLITNVNTNQLIFGKVFGAAIVGLMQLTLIIVTAFLGFTLNFSNWQNFSIDATEVVAMTVNPRLLILAVVFFLVGFFVYAFMYAAVGSTVSRLEEANTVSTIPVFLILGAFFVAMGSMSNPNNMLAKVTSYLPFFSPFVMFMRISVTDIPNINIAIALIINILTIIVVGNLCARVYRAGVLMYGKPPSVIQLLKLVFSKQDT